MTESKERKKKAPSKEQTQRAQQISVGEILRRARLERGLGLEQVSSTINIRVAQLRALEEGNIEALPGMTYALGFVKSYANYLRLNGGEIVHKFKAEHGGAQSSKPEFHLPEPLEESKMPNPQILAIAGVFVVLLLVLWAVFSGDDKEESRIAAQIPPPPVVQPLSEMASAPLFAEATAAETPGTPEAAPSATGDAVADMMAPSAPVTALESAENPVDPIAVTAAPVQKQEMEVKPAGVVAEEGAAPTTGAVIASQQNRKQKEPVLQEQAQSQSQAKEQNEGVISVSRGKGRIMLQSVQPSWIQVSDAHEKVIFKKVLRPGEQYFVPNESGISLVTSNAGGLEIYVDGKKVQALGQPGEILRGIAMDPQELKKTKIRVRN